MAKKTKKPKLSPGLRKKAKSSPYSPSFNSRLLQEALAHHRTGRFSQAETLYKRILAVEPDHPEALHFLGILAHQTGRNEIAAELLDRAIGCKPDYVDAYVNLGSVLNSQGKLDEAINSYRQAISLKPDYAEAHSNLGIAYMEQGKLDEAIASFRQALLLKPNLAEVHYNLGNAYKNKGKLAEAVASYRRSLALRPDFAEVHNNLGETLYDLGKTDDAIASLRKSVALNPNFFGALNNLGKALKNQGKWHDAIACFRKALELKPDFVKALLNLGNALQDLDKLDEASSCYRQALGIKPDSADSYSNLGNALMAQNKLDEAIANYRRAITCKADYFAGHSNLLLALNYLTDLPLPEYLNEAVRFGRQATENARKFTAWSCNHKPDRLRIGMVSGDFRDHSVGYFLENLLMSHDPAKIEFYAYQTSCEDTELTNRIRSRFVGWRSIQGIPDEAAATMIHDDEIHILLDLAGHTRHNRLPVFAWKPAPIQASWLGYSASTGLAEMDYLIADPHVIPLGREVDFTEKIWRLPESYICFSPPHDPLPVTPLPALKAKRITFGSFNNPAKMNDSVIALWAKVLLAIPDSRLYLKAKQFGNGTFSDFVQRRFLAFGIKPERLFIEGYKPLRGEHLAAYHRVDIALDPFPYNGTTTSVEGLWMGVPFITLSGEHFVSRVGGSIAYNAGLTDWIANDEEDYVAKAAIHAADLEKLSALRVGMRQRLLASPLFDGSRFSRHFEEAMWGMWHRFLSKESAAG